MTGGTRTSRRPCIALGLLVPAASASLTTGDLHSREDLGHYRQGLRTWHDASVVDGAAKYTVATSRARGICSRSCGVG
ncbi:unnamed protein product [Amoebophrya sp. A120]|nr:unnamed protein product [Amoebophrya sp. A120]|eukprot:GSA120T00015628001.1